MSSVSARPSWYVKTGSMFDNVYGVPKDEIVRYLRDNVSEVAAQVVFGKYVESSGLVFSTALINGMVDRKLPRVTGNDWEDPEAADYARVHFVQGRFEFGQRYHIGVDLARQTDRTVISVLDCLERPARLVYWKQLRRVPWETIYGEIGRARYLFGPNVLVDGSGPAGDVILEALQERVYCSKHHRTLLISHRQCLRDGKAMDCKPESYVSLSCVDGYVFGGTTKKELVEHLRNVLAVGYDARRPTDPYGWIRTPPIVQLEEELTFYAWDDKRLETDALFSLALAAWSGLEDAPGPIAFGAPWDGP